MKKIAFVISSLDLGGAQRAVANITLSLKEDYDIDIILNDDSNIVYPYKGNICSLGIENPSDRTNLLYQARVFFSRIRYLRDAKINNKYDAVISFLDSANIANILSGNKHCKTIISVRTNLSESHGWKYRYIVGLLARLFYNRADLIVTLSNGVREDLINNFSVQDSKVCTIYNGYDVDDIVVQSHMHVKFEIDDNCINFVSMGRLTYAKGQWHLIRAFAELFKTRKNIRLYILGVGELEGYLNSLIKDYELEDVVYLVGFIENPYSLLDKMDVFVFPSLYEGFGNALVEAMACGLPCIATDYKSGAREILTNGYDGLIKDAFFAEYGIIVPGMSTDYWAKYDNLDSNEIVLMEAMMKMVDDSDLRNHYSKMSRNRARQFSLERVAAEWEKII
ncbi:glycosyltransferase [Butyrivibrio sp. VCB2006]|uniref:glycosyltransferase n=1 Tax=Butyrivibrio sp. VCB2006 TaxID=1280679 RepID=UPI0004253793|nr:glycosyltransferase [Butyrivibrio sp. VCB2006]